MFWLVVEFLVDVPEFVDTDFKVRSFRKGEVRLLPESLVKPFLDSGMAEETHKGGDR